MPRLRQVPADEADPFAKMIYKVLFGERDPVEQPGTATGTPGNWWTVFALSPDTFKHTTEGFQYYRDPKRKLSPQLRELAQTRAGFARGSQFVYSQHCKASRSVGLSEEKVRAVPYWQIAECYSSQERAVLAYADCLVLQGGRVPEEIFQVLRSDLSDEEILELTYITCTYEMHATISRALRLEFDDVDERVVEVAAPRGASDDVMKIVDTQKE